MNEGLYNTLWLQIGQMGLPEKFSISSSLIVQIDQIQQEHSERRLVHYSDIEFKSNRQAWPRLFLIPLRLRMIRVFIMKSESNVKRCDSHVGDYLGGPRGLIRVNDH